MNRYYISCEKMDPVSDLIKKGAKVIYLNEWILFNIEVHYILLSPNAGVRKEMRVAIKNGLLE